MDFRKVITGSLGNRRAFLSRERIVERLSHQKVTNAKVEGGLLIFDYDGSTHRYKVEKRKHEAWVGTWSWAEQKIIYDDDIKLKKDLLCILVHEGVERYVATRYDLERNYVAHYVAQNVERKFAQSIGNNWEEYSLRTEMIYRKENPCGR